MKILTIFLLLVFMVCNVCAASANTTDHNKICNTPIEPLSIVEKPQLDLPLLKPIIEKPTELLTNYSDTILVSVTEDQKRQIEQQVSTYEEEIIIMAKITWREARGIKDVSQKAAVMWCILNRYDSGLYGDTITEVATAPAQFAWKYDTIVDNELYLLAKDVVTRWLLEKNGYENVGRVLPKEYCFFWGDGNYNYFRTTNNTLLYWNWDLESPY